MENKNLWKIKTPYGVKNWAYIKRLMDQDVKGNKVKIEVLGGVAEVTECPEHITIEILDHD